MVEIQKYTKFQIIPEIEIQYETNFRSYQYEKNIEINIYKFIDLEKLAANFEKEIKNSSKLM